MSNEILKKHLSDLKIETLRKLLGEDIVESLLEWELGTITKSKYSEILCSIHGVKLFKNPEFRYHILLTLRGKQADTEIPILKKLAKSKKDDKNEIIKDVAKCKWNKSELSKEILGIFGYTLEDAFPQKETDEKSIVQVDANERFYELLDYQYVIKQRALTNLTDGVELKRFLIHMPTGTGKTKTAMHIICHHINFNLRKKGLVLWIANTVELLRQAESTFEAVWRNLGDGSINVYKLWGTNEPSLGDETLNGFMVCSIQKLLALTKNSHGKNLFNKIVNDVRLVVFDEAHKAFAKEWSDIVDQLMIKKRGMQDRALIGLTATPGRTTSISGENSAFVNQFGSNIISIDTEIINRINLSEQDADNATAEMDIIKYFQQRGVLSKIKKEELEYPECLTEEEMKGIRLVATEYGYDDFSKDALEIIGKNRFRNIRIIERIKELNRDDFPTIVFACSLSHAQLLSSALTLAGVPNALVTGNMDATDRKNAIAYFKDRSNPLNVLINYEVLTTGFDATNIKCVFITRPTNSVVLYSQMLGRGLRGPQMGGNEECLLIDVKDNLKKYDEHLAFSHFNNYWNY